MEKKAKQTLRKEKIIGMQVIDSSGYIRGKVKELSLVVGEPDQALVIEDEDGNESEAPWSRISAAGDVILLKSEEYSANKSSSSMSHRCPSCNSEIGGGAMFCTNCGTDLR
ncbi:zinc-ribbon domain-containing protein [Methanococcoides burtonii]|uniref:PRC-barrel domain protein n=1 Tax=Methanococcoides burtonii (strain DSM 6242 / NBRC 107633 / OCM 468 / ACE-M) TaxID=259564 RepID=Q12Z07_METBU|nr:zinc-ribbon domain-containing protein [Methanococcoides burtonii]ABE51319.1 PRC-barrel domain protein [Methanococcoides burtonii DSM 6242]